MTRRRELEQHRHTLDETREILDSMKTLAYMETRKLDRGLDGQRALVAQIETMASDFLSFYPDKLARYRGSKRIYLLVGSERGFCGDFNQRLLDAWTSISERAGSAALQGVATGRKLCMLLDREPRIRAFIDGISVAEEIDGTLGTIMETLLKLGAAEGAVALTVLYNDPEVDQVVTSEILPPFADYRTEGPLFSHPPVLNLSPQAFFDELVSHYLLARLHMILYSSLMAENLRRVQHLDGALRHLDKRATELQRRCNTLRQEEIIEEIEVILLSTPSLVARRLV
jgi:F-type H+-transporting ATPase subunit gamma